MEKVFFIGLCGVSMSALAVILKNDGCEVSGVDRKYKNPPLCLMKEEIQVLAESDFSNLKTADLVVYSSAIKEDNVALKKARSLNKKCIERGALLGQIASKYEKVIAVAGSHGKTTTTAMIYHILKVAGKKPALHLGGNLCNERTNVVAGEKEFFVCEACEYHDNFLQLFPHVGVVTNIEKEHLDYFKTFSKEKASFSKFKNQCEVAIDKTKYKAKSIKINGGGGVSFWLTKDDKKLIKIDLKLGGFFNVQNALFAIEACEKLGINLSIIRLGLNSFAGIQKRLEKIKCNGKDIIVDYAHHPTEIQKSYDFLRKMTKKTQIIFQPHTFSRTKTLLSDFIKVLSDVENLYLFPTYSAREKPKDGMSALELKKALNNTGTKVKYIKNASEVKRLISRQKDDEITVLMGAGDLPEKLKIY